MHSIEGAMLTDLFPEGMTHYLAGGLMIGAAVGLLFLLTGLIGGMSTVFTSTWSFVSQAPFFHLPRFLGSRGWRLVYAAGLVLGGLTYLLAGGEPFQTQVPAWRLLIGGFFIGFGARLGNGCTAGHGICGLASLQAPALLAVATFLATAIGVAHLLRALGVA
ncbi:YeeE/YedE family protein [Methyloparacoccus murrellii]